MEERKLRIIAGNEEAGMTVKELLLRKLHMTARQISRLKFLENGIRVDGSRVTVRHVLAEGETVELMLASSEEERDVREGNRGILPERNESLWAEPAEGLPPFTVLYEDEDVLAAEKPAGIPTHPSHGHYCDTLANQAAAYLGVKRCEDLHVIGRLDRDTSGIVLFARNTAAAAQLSRQRADGRLKKTYRALVCGCPPQDEGVIDLPLARVSEKENRMAVDPAGKKAATYYRVLEKREGETLLEVTIEQGRTHQIRAHMAAIGCPVKGDVIYGGAVKPDLKLKAVSVAFEKPFANETVTVNSKADDKELSLCRLP